jgi:hypothetical protein
VFGSQVKVADAVAGALRVSVTGIVCGVFDAPVAVRVIVALWVAAWRPFVLTDKVTESVSVVVVPEVAFKVNQVWLSVIDHVSVPPPGLVMFRSWKVGFAAPWVAANEKLVGLAPIAGLTGTPGAEGGVISCANPGISAANLRIDRPPALPLPEVEEFPAPAAASGMVPVDAVLAAVDPVAAADDGVTLMVARGTATLTLLLGDDGSLGWEVVLSLCSDNGCVGSELTGEESDGKGSTDAMGGFCGFRISRCGLWVEVCAPFFSKDFVGYGKVGAMFSIRRPWVSVPPVSWLIGLVSCWAEVEGIGWNSDTKTAMRLNEIA